MKCRLAYSRLKMLFPLRHILSVPQKLLATQSLIVSLFNYADVVDIPCLNKRLLHRIQLIHNSCLRLSYGIRKYDHISPSYQRSGWLNIYQRFIVHLCCTTYKTLHSNTPMYLRDLLHFNYPYIHAIKIFFPVLLIIQENFKMHSRIPLENFIIRSHSTYAQKPLSLLSNPSCHNTFLSISDIPYEKESLARYYNLCNTNIIITTQKYYSNYM